MMCKRLLALMLIGLLCLAILPEAVLAEETESGGLLVVTEAGSDEAAKVLGALKGMMMHMNKRAAYRAMEDFPAPEGYEGMILCLGETSELPKTYVTRLEASGTPIFVIGPGGIRSLCAETEVCSGNLVAHTDTDVDLLLKRDSLVFMTGECSPLGGTLYVGEEAYPLCQTKGQLTHMAYFDPAEDVMRMELATLLQAWQWPYQNAPTAYGQFLVLNEVYPFDEPADLMTVTDMLREEGVPYAISVMPIYSNADYPAMKRFCEFLRYEQGRGTGVILRAPHASILQVDEEELLRAIEIGYEAYSLYGVYPLALEVPEFWLMQEKGLRVLSGWRTLFLFETDEELTAQASYNDANEAYRYGHQLVAPAWDRGDAFTSAYAQAIYLDPRQDVEEMRTYVKRLKASRRILKSMGQMENVIYLGDDLITSGATGLQVNGQFIDTAYQPFVYEEYVYDRGFVQYMTEQIEASNRLVLVFVGVASTMFVVMILLLRRQKREQILGRAKDRKRTEEAL